MKKGGFFFEFFGVGECLTNTKRVLSIPLGMCHAVFCTNKYKKVTTHKMGAHTLFPTHLIPNASEWRHQFQINNMVVVSPTSHLCVILTQPNI